VLPPDPVPDPDPDPELDPDPDPDPDPELDPELDPDPDPELELDAPPSASLAGEKQHPAANKSATPSPPIPRRPITPSFYHAPPWRPRALR
jgi:hypothetical protein